MSIIIATRGLYRRVSPPAPEGIVPTVHLEATETSGTSAVDAEGVQNGLYVGSPDLGLPAMEAGGGGFGVKDGQHVSIAHNAAFAVAGGWCVHFKFMISKALTVSGERYGLVSKASLGANEVSIEVRFDGADHKLRAYTTTDASVARFIPPTGGSLGVGPALVVGTTYGCTLVQSPTGASLYLNAQELATNDVLDGLDNNTANWGIGCYLHPTQGALVPFNGCIAGWRFYNVPLTGGQIAELPVPINTIWLRDVANVNIDAGLGKTLDLASFSHPEEGITAVAGDDDPGGVVTHGTPTGSSLVLDTTAVTINTPAEITATVTKDALTSREATIDITVLPSGAFAMQPVTIQGDRFYSGGQPYFPITHFLWEPGTPNNSHVYWSHVISADNKLTIANTIKNASEGFNCIYLYTLNENDYSNRSVSPYVGNGVAFTTFNDAKLASWRDDLINFINDGIRPILWLRADDSPTINSYSAANFKSYMQRMIDEFDDLPIMWVLGLEVDEYWSVSQINDFGSHLASIATQPVGVHLLSGSLDIFDETWVQFGMAQEDRTSHTNAVDHYEYMKAAKALAGNKPVVFSEYQQGHPGAGTTTEARRFALAGSFAPAAGYGNGGPDGLRAFMESLPDGQVSSRVGNIITLTGGGVTAEADLDAITWQIVTPQTWGFIDFKTDNNATGNRHYTIPHGAALDCIASTGWAWGCFLRLGQNAGTGVQTILASGAALANPSFIFDVLEAGTAAPNKFEAFLSDQAADFALLETGASVVLNQTLLAVVQYNPGTGNTEMWIKGPSGAATMIASETGPDGDIIAPDVWYWGRRTEGDNTRYWQEEMGGLFKAGRVLTGTDIDDIYTDGPQAVLGGDLDGFWACLNGEQLVEADLVGGNDATRVGTWGTPPPSGGDAPLRPSLAEWLVSDEATPSATKFVSSQNRGNGSGSSAANAQEVQAALNGAARGQTFVAVCQTPGTIEHWNYPNGLSFPGSLSGTGFITLQARLGDGVVINIGGDFIGAATPNSGFWTQSGLSADDISKDIWRSVGTFSGGEQAMMGWWIEFDHPHQIVRATNMTNLRAAYGTANSPGNYSIPMVHKFSDGRVYIRFQRPHPGKYSVDNKWSETTWPDNPEAVNNGQIVYPMSENPNNYVIYLTRVNATPVPFNPGGSGHHIKIGAGINSCGGRWAITGGNNIRMDRGTHYTWHTFVQASASGAPRSHFFFNRVRCTDGSKLHGSRAEWKFGGWLEGIRSACFQQINSATLDNYYWKDCTIGDYHELFTSGYDNASQIRWRNCTFKQILDDGIQAHYNMNRVEFGYCYFYNSAYGGMGSGGAEPNTPNPGQFYRHHNIVDYRQERCTEWRGQPHPGFIYGPHSPNGQNAYKGYNNLIMWGPDNEEEFGHGLMHCPSGSASLLTGAANMHETFNNIILRVFLEGTKRYDNVSSAGTANSSNNTDRSDFVNGRRWIRYGGDSNEIFDYNCYWRPSQMNVDALLKDYCRTAGSVPEQNLASYSSLAAWRGSAEFTFSKNAGDARGAYSPGFDGNSTDVKPTLATLDDYPASRFTGYRPSPTAVVTVAKTGSISGADWWSGLGPSWGRDYFPWNDGERTLAPGAWKGALDPNGSTMPVGVINP